jgi:5-hydroxyisourate hydrolase
MSPITTHVLDTANGTPAANLRVVLERRTDDGFVSVGEGVTNSDGRVADLLTKATFVVGTYRICFFGLSDYNDGFYPEARICFLVNDISVHYHVPLLLSPYGYSTYRGS